MPSAREEREVRFNPAESILWPGLISIISAQLRRKNNADNVAATLVNWEPVHTKTILTWDRLGGDGGEGRMQNTNTNTNTNANFF